MLTHLKTLQTYFNYSTNTNRRSTGANTGLAKVAVQCSADTFVVNQSLVLRINICGENRHLRQARKRKQQANPRMAHSFNIDTEKSILTGWLYVNRSKFNKFEQFIGTIVWSTLCIAIIFCPTITYF